MNATDLELNALAQKYCNISPSSADPSSVSSFICQRSLAGACIKFSDN